MEIVYHLIERGIVPCCNYSAAPVFCKVWEKVAGHLFHFPQMIRNNLIRNNTSCWDGGGIYLTASSPDLENNMIAGDDAPWGGGI
ncbi:MAG: hypothetical protein KJ645_04900 [Planctomycetes bacterium]|nr:hypothetical protein [Planctomycetota bacterium]